MPVRERPEYPVLLPRGQSTWAVLTGRLAEPERQPVERPSHRRRRDLERAEKQELVASLKEVFSNTSVVVVTHYSGLNVSEITDLRNRVREAGASFRVTKNKLTRLALDGTGYQPLESYFDGPTAIGYSDDPVAAPKALVKFAKDNEKLVVLGGMMGANQLDVEGIRTLASLSSLDELRGTIVGLLGRPATKIAQILQAPAAQVARVISAYGAKDAA